VFGLNAVGIIGANQVNRFLLRRWTPERVLSRASLVSVGFAGLLALAGVLHDGSPRPMALVMLGALIGSALALRFLALPGKRAPA
jgi:DHA1 family bicyclomycin/chloramphenicol resistance-like MFS transporter